MKERLFCAVLLSGIALWPSRSHAQDRPPDAAPAQSKPDSSGESKPAEAAKPGEAKAGEAKPATTSRDRRIRDLEDRVEKLTRALAELKTGGAQSQPAAPAAPPAPPPPPPSDPKLDPLRGIVVTGYTQVQLENHEDSEDQIRPGGAPYNLNRFLIRRGRLRVQREWDFSSVMLEFDGNTVKGPAVSLYHAEASLFYRGDAHGSSPPLIKATLGLFDTPFGFELVESPRTRFFMERSLSSRAWFPSEPDLGLRLSGGIAWFRYAIAVLNGEPIGSADGFGGQDPNNHKDVVARIGAVATPAKDAEIAGGVSVLNGKGFVKGSDGTKNALAWTDNGNQTLQTSEIIGVPGAAASPSYNFDRWSMGADLQVQFKTVLGQTRFFGELELGSNMDRGLFVANPTLSGQPSRELGYYAAVVQDITPYGAMGFRTDYYDPNADFLGYQSGKLIPVSESVRTYSPVVALVLPGHARLVFQYDFVKDHMGRTETGRVTDLKNDQWTLRLQGEL